MNAQVCQKWGSTCVWNRPPQASCRPDQGPRCPSCQPGTCKGLLQKLQKEKCQSASLHQCQGPAGSGSQTEVSGKLRDRLAGPGSAGSMCACAHTLPIHTHTPTATRTLTRIHTHIYSHSYTHTHTHTLICTYSHLHAHSHTGTTAHSWPHTITKHICTRADTHICLHTHVCRQ